MCKETRYESRSRRESRSQSLETWSEFSSPNPGPSNTKKRRDLNDMIEDLEKEAAGYVAKIKKIKVEEKVRYSKLLEEQKKGTQSLETLCTQMERREETTREETTREERREFMDLFREILKKLSKLLVKLLLSELLSESFMKVFF